MKVMVQEVENEGLVSLLGQTVTLFCNTYIYAGTLVGVNDTCVKLENAHVVYETGTFGTGKYKDAQKKLPGSWYVTTQTIESFGVAGMNSWPTHSNWSADPANLSWQPAS